MAFSKAPQIKDFKDQGVRKGNEIEEIHKKKNCNKSKVTAAWGMCSL